MAEEKKRILRAKGFDAEGFYRALEATVRSRDLTWKQVAEVTGVSTSTLARMAQGSKPDAASLAVLAAWAGLNPTSFVTGSYVAQQPEAMAVIASALHSDPKLDASSATAIENIVRAAYENFKNSKK